MIRYNVESLHRNSTSTRISAFTIIELFVVIAIILILAGLILSTVGYAQKKAARSRAEIEIAALSAALESYKSDNGIYASSSDTTTLDPRTSFDPSAYSAGSLYLYEQLTGVTTGNRSETPSGRTYFSFKPNMLLPAPPSTADITAIRDPFGNSYGYSTAGNPQANPTPAVSPAGYNPTFDLWSTAGYTPTSSPSPTPIPQNFWIKNW